MDVGGERIELAWHGRNHPPNNIIIHLPDHDTLTLVDIVNRGWGRSTTSTSPRHPRLPRGPGHRPVVPWKHYIGGHLGRLGTRDDVEVHQQYMADIDASVRTALPTVDPTPYFQKYGENVWAGVKGYLDAVADTAAARSSTSTPACWPPPTCSLPAPPFWSWSRSASTSATAPSSTPDLGEVTRMSSSAIRNPLADQSHHATERGADPDRRPARPVRHGPIHGPGAAAQEHGVDGEDGQDVRAANHPFDGERRLRPGEADRPWARRAARGRSADRPNEHQLLGGRRLRCGGARHRAIAS